MIPQSLFGKTLQNSEISAAVLKRFGCIQDARTFCRHIFTWYNRNHHHLGIGLMTPDQVHYGQADKIYAARQLTPSAAAQTHCGLDHPPSRELIIQA